MMKKIVDYIEREVGHRYAYEELCLGDLVMWNPPYTGISDSSKWLGIITHIQFDEEIKKCVVWLDGELSTECAAWCRRYGGSEGFKAWMYLGRLPNNLKGYLNPPSE